MADRISRANDGADADPAWDPSLAFQPNAASDAAPGEDPGDEPAANPESEPGSEPPGRAGPGPASAPKPARWSGHPELDDDPGPRSFPSNVSELLTRAQLDNARDVFKLVETRSDLSPYQERELAVKIIQKLAAFHEDVIDGLISEDKAESVAAWAMDLNRIRVAISLLEAVELSDD